MGVLAVGKSSLTTRDPHIPSAGVGSFVGIVTKWTQGNGMVKKAHVSCPACLTLLMAPFWHQGWAHPLCSLRTAVHILRVLCKCLLNDFESIYM